MEAHTCGRGKETCTHVGYAWGSAPKWKDKEIKNMGR